MGLKCIKYLGDDKAMTHQASDEPAVLQAKLRELEQFRGKKHY